MKPSRKTIEILEELHESMSAFADNDEDHLEAAALRALLDWYETEGKKK